MKPFQLVLLFLVVQTSALAQQSYTTLFNPGESGYNCFRIPAVVKTVDGSVLAFAEARKSSCSDTGNIDLVMKKSNDNGQTWSALKVIWDDGNNVCGNPAPVVDEKTGIIHLLLTWNNGDDHESDIITGKSEESREVFHMQSSDSGANWTAPRNITATTKLKNWTWYATGPVHGIQIKRGAHEGRLIIPSDHIEKDSKKYYSHIIYSDDGGQHWELGGRTPLDQVNECTIAELENGDLLLNMRNYKRSEGQVRQTAISNDGGTSWSQQKFDKNLPEPRCQGALLTVERNGEQLVLFTNPSDENKRVNMTLSISRNQGVDWDEKITLYGSHAAYSDLVELENSKILVLFEAGESRPYEGIHYKIVDVK